MNYTYGVEVWDEKRKLWRPHRFDCHSLEEVGEVIDLLNIALPGSEFRPAQYTIEEYQYIRSFS